MAEEEHNFILQPKYFIFYFILLRYNSQNIKFAILKYTIWYIYYAVQPLLLSNSKTFPSEKGTFRRQKKNL